MWRLMSLPKHLNLNKIEWFYQIISFQISDVNEILKASKFFNYIML